MKLTFSFLLLLISCSVFTQNKEVVLYGNSKDFANHQLIIEYTNNFITHENGELQRFMVDKKGDFKVSFPVSEITKVTIKLGAIKGFLFVKPNHTYEIILPPNIPLRPEDQLNPFYLHEELNIGILNDDPNKLNQNIEAFNEYYDSYVNRSIKKIVIGKNKKLIDEIVHNCDSLFPSSSNLWFNNYKKYAYQPLFSLKDNGNIRTVTNDYFNKHKIEYNSPSYWQSFNKTYKNFFSQYFSSDIGDSLKYKINTKADFASLTITLSDDSIFSDKKLAELILLKGIYDAFYSKNYNNNYLIQLVEQATNTCNSEINKEIAAGILKKITRLRTGTKAPNFELPNLKGKIKSLDKYKGKFVYINFSNTKNYACKKDFQVLQTMAKAYKKDLHIISIITDDNIEEAEKYITNNKYSWNFLHFNQNGKVLYDYNVRAYPTYYLIDPEGNILLSPAPSPEEDFSAIFSETYNNYRHQQLRKNKPKERTIYDL